jgi:hypothetical protein
MSSHQKVGAVGRAEIQRLVGEQLSGAAWAPLFEERTVTRKLGRMWVVHPAADRIGGPWIYADSRGKVRRVDFTSPGQRLLQLLAVLVLVIGLAFLVLRFYPKRWCGTEVTASGATRKICRDPEVTDPAIVALGLVILAALGVFFAEISGFGLTLKRRVDEADTNARESLNQISDLQAVRKLLQETQLDFADANLRSNDRITKLERAILVIQDQLARSGDGGDGRSPETGGPEESVSAALPTGPSTPTAQRASPSISSTTDGGNGTGQADAVADVLSADDVLDYAAEYDLIRSTMVAGPARSARMEEIFSGMRSAVQSIRPSDRGIARSLSNPSNDRGIRLAAYAYLMEHPVPELVAPLINAAAKEDKPFGQYCALRAVKMLVKESKTRLTPELATRLNEIAITAGRGTDRAREVGSILAADRTKPAADT